MGTVVYDYYWNDCKLYGMTITKGSSITTLMFAYDSEGMPFAMSYNGTLYYYCTDVQGNVLGIIDEYGLCAYYRYDAWGNILTIDAASTAPYNAIMANPLRYRGYIYDTETELYYLQSRYYDPAIGRFLNADDVSYIGATGTVLSMNLISYCENDTVNMFDPEGTDAIWLQNSTIVPNAGHTGLLIEHDGYWYYWYWGAGEGQSKRAVLGFKVSATRILIKVCQKRILGLHNTKYVLRNILNALVPKRYNQKEVIMKTDGFIYFFGDFENTYDYLCGTSNQKYHLYNNNCMQISTRALFLSYGNVGISKYLAVKKITIPNIAYKLMIKNAEKRGDFYVYNI